ncbi:unnamed protein product [Sphagnum jensenii]|uniref:Uncharacterized protein n=1 Tax=Sphagnum jensenii TaxID=128206 RepID=A0ABP1B3T8_9BRYO
MTLGCSTQDNKAQDAGQKSDESPTDRMQVGLPVGLSSHGNRTNIGQVELSRHYYDGKWRRHTAAPSNATLRRG